MKFNENTDDSFLSLMPSILIVVFGFLMLIGFIVGSIWMLTEGVNWFMASNTGLVQAYQNLNQLVRSLIESAFIIVFISFMGSVVIWANIASKKTTNKVKYMGLINQPK